MTLYGWRGVLALAVVAYHLGVLPFGWLAVDVFFLLSGYALTARYHGDYCLNIGSYVRARVRRLLGWYAVAVAVMLPISSAVHAGYWHYVAASIFLVNTWVVPFVPSDQAKIWALGMLPVAWSLSVEVALYAAFPWLRGGVLRGRSRRMICRVLTGCAVVYAGIHWALPVLGGWLPWDGVAWWSRPWLLWWLYFPPMRLPEFIAGCCVAQLWRTDAGRRGVNRWLGDASYPLYLLHLPVMYWTALVFSGGRAWWRVA